MDYKEQQAYDILKAAHVREQADKKYPRPFVEQTGGGDIAGRLNPNWHRTYWRRRLMDMLGIPVTRRWLRRQ